MKKERNLEYRKPTFPIEITYSEAQERLEQQLMESILDKAPEGVSTAYVSNEVLEMLYRNSEHGYPKTLSRTYHRGTDRDDTIVFIEPEEHMERLFHVEPGEREPSRDAVLAELGMKFLELTPEKQAEILVTINGML